MSFYYFFLLRGVGGWVRSLIENSINFFIFFLNPSLNSLLLNQEDDIVKTFQSKSNVKSHYVSELRLYRPYHYR